MSSQQSELGNLTNHNHIAVERDSALSTLHSSPAKPRGGRVYVLPNRMGLLMLFILTVMLLGSINYNNNLGYALTFLLVGTWVISLLHAYRNVAAVEILGAKAAPVFAGEEAVFEIHLRNPAARLRCALELSAKVAATPVNVSFDLAGLTTFSVRLAIPTSQRGLLRLPRLRLATCFPLGVCTAWMNWEDGASCLVYPSPVGVLPLPVAAQPQMPSQTGAQTGDEDFAGLRDYRPGDSLRHIAWKALARERGLHVKKFAGSGEQRVRLRQSELRYLGNTEAQFSQLARWVLDAEQRGLAYSLELDGESIGIGSDTAQRDNCLRALALYGAA